MKTFYLTNIEEVYIRVSHCYRRVLHRYSARLPRKTEINILDFFSLFYYYVGYHDEDSIMSYWTRWCTNDVIITHEFLNIACPIIEEFMVDLMGNNINRAHIRFFSKKSNRSYASIYWVYFCMKSEYDEEEYGIFGTYMHRT